VVAALTFAYIHYCIIHICKQLVKKNYLIALSTRASSPRSMPDRVFRELTLDFVYQLGASGLALDSQRSGRRHHTTAIGRMVDAADQPIGFEAVDQLRNVGTNARHLGSTLGEAQRLGRRERGRSTRHNLANDSPTVPSASSSRFSTVPARVHQQEHGLIGSGWHLTKAGGSFVHR